jgi:hypothetical protein
MTHGATEYVPIDLQKVTTYPLQQRKSLVQCGDFGRPCAAGASFKGFMDSLPRILAGADLRAVIDAIVLACKNGRPVILAMGAHVIKCGLSPVIIHLMKHGIVSAIAMNGAGAIHDLEVALLGETSEDIADGLRDGTFGMASETGLLINEAINEADRCGMGLGESVVRKIIDMDAPFRQYSILAHAREAKIPATVHVAIGTDIVHMHPTANGAAMGAASFWDFRLLASVVADLGRGGVYLNVGSAVVLPEVFLKALTVARNLGHDVTDFTAVNLDMQQHYRPQQNVVKRPCIDDSKGYLLTGHHELLIPLIAQAVVETLDVT